MYEVRFTGRGSGAVARALEDFEIVDDGRDTVVVVVDPPALVALVNRASDLGLAIEGVTRIPGSRALPPS